MPSLSSSSSLPLSQRGQGAVIPVLAKGFPALDCRTSHPGPPDLLEQVGIAERVECVLCVAAETETISAAARTRRQSVRQRLSSAKLPAVAVLLEGSARMGTVELFAVLPYPRALVLRGHTVDAGEVFA